MGIMMEMIHELAAGNAEHAIDSRGKRNGPVYIADMVDVTVGPNGRTGYSDLIGCYR